jgi:hypothetical protein
MLPNESLRLFYLDANWTDALLDGALSIGIHSGRDLLLQKAINSVLRKETDKKLGQVQDLLKGKTNPDAPKMTKLGTVSGMLIRSALVSNFPSLEITAFEDTYKDFPLEVLRMERLAANILLVIFDSVPACIEIKSPEESRLLAVVKSGEMTRIYLRNQKGEPVGNEAFKLEKHHFRSKNKRVLNIKKLQIDLAKRLETEALSPSWFALQFLQSPKTFELVNENVEVLTGRDAEMEVRLDKRLIFSKLFM